MELIPEGTYPAKILGGAFHTNEKGTQVGVRFQLTGRKESIWYYGSLYGEYSMYAFQNLARLGFDESKFDKEVLESGKETSQFDASFFEKKDQDFELVIEHWTNKEGKKNHQVKYINESGGGKFGKVSSVEMKKTLTGLNFRGELAAARAKLGLKPSASSDAPQFNSDEPLPY